MKYLFLSFCVLLIGCQNYSSVNHRNIFTIDQILNSDEKFELQTFKNSDYVPWRNFFNIDNDLDTFEEVNEFLTFHCRLNINDYVLNDKNINLCKNIIFKSTSQPYWIRGNLFAKGILIHRVIAPTQLYICKQKVNNFLSNISNNCIEVFQAHGVEIEQNSDIIIKAFIISCRDQNGHKICYSNEEKKLIESPYALIVVK